MAKDQPFMKFYVNDYLSSPTVSCMSLAQQGAYIRLLCFCWASGNASLPDDDRQLAVLSGAGEGYLDLGWSLVRGCFIKHPTLVGKLTHPKVYELQQEMEIQAEKSRKGGQKSAKIRAAKAKAEKVKKESKPPSVLVDSLVATKTQPKSNQSESESELELESDIKNTPLIPSFVEQAFSNPGGQSGDIDHDTDWLVAEHEFMTRWNSTVGVSRRDRPAIPGDLKLTWMRLWSDKEWRQRALRALGMFPLKNGSIISLKRFLNESTVDDILGGVYDFQKGKTHDSTRFPTEDGWDAIKSETNRSRRVSTG